MLNSNDVDMELQSTSRSFLVPSSLIYLAHTSFSVICTMTDTNFSFTKLGNPVALRKGILTTSSSRLGSLNWENLLYYHSYLIEPLKLQNTTDFFLFYVFLWFLRLFFFVCMFSFFNLNSAVLFSYSHITQHCLMWNRKQLNSNN